MISNIRVVQKSKKCSGHVLENGRYFPREWVEHISYTIQQVQDGGGWTDVEVIQEWVDE